MVKNKNKWLMANGCASGAQAYSSHQQYALCSFQLYAIFYVL
jgi:hypothetical protein